MAFVRTGCMDIVVSSIRHSPSSHVDLKHMAVFRSSSVTIFQPFKFTVVPFYGWNQSNGPATESIPIPCERVRVARLIPLRI